VRGEKLIGPGVSFLWCNRAAYINTKFHIDFEWWSKKDRDFRVHLRSHLCPECQAIYTNHLEAEEVDWIDPETAEVTKVDGLWQCLRTHCSHLPDYITEKTALTTSIFRLFLANGNTPLSPVELHRILGKPTPEIILRTLSGRKIYGGIKPIPSEEEQGK
jgi:hypothetical protein